MVQQIFALAKLGVNVTLVLGNTMGRPTSPYLTVDDLGLPSNYVQLIEFDIIRFPEKLSSIPGVAALNTKSIGLCLNHCIAKTVSDFGPFEGCIVHGLRYMGLAINSWQKHIQGDIAIVIHGVDPFFDKLSNSEWASKILVREADKYKAIVLVGTPLVPHALSLAVSKKKVRIIPNGTEIIDQASVSDKQRSCFDKRIILSVSNLIELKGINLNLLALAEIKQRLPDCAWEYHIVGDGPELERLIKLANTLGIGDNIHFFGRISYKETMQKMADADIFSLPSWGEAFGIVYLEAMMRMRPVIGCFENGAADIIVNGVNGLLVPPQNIIALAESLEVLLLSPDLCQKLGQEGRKTAENFSCKYNALEMLKVLGLSTDNVNRKYVLI